MCRTGSENVLMVITNSLNLSVHQPVTHMSFLPQASYISGKSCLCSLLSALSGLNYFSSMDCHLDVGGDRGGSGWSFISLISTQFYPLIPIPNH
jgi:hypothetical protein